MEKPQPRGGVVVTGAACGIGKAMAQVLSDSGYGVVGVDLREASFEPWIVGDVSQAETHRRAIAAAIDRFGSLVGYINNAGIIHRTAFLETEDDVFDQVVSVNLRGAFLGIREAARTMAQSGGGHIVSVSSGHAVLAGYDRAVYAATKAGIEALTRNAAVELGHMNILVNAVAPGFTFTEMSRGSLIGERLKFVEKRLPLGRVSEPEEVAHTVEALLSGRIAGMTGQVLRIDGGWSNSDIQYSQWRPT